MQCTLSCCNMFFTLVKDDAAKKKKKTLRYQKLAP